MVRLVAPVSVAVGTDSAMACDLLVRAAESCESIAREPRPRAFFQGFGDGALKLELSAYVRTVDNLASTRSELHSAIDRAFQDADIAIARSQCDVRMQVVGGAAGL